MVRFIIATSDFSHLARFCIQEKHHFSQRVAKCAAFQPLTATSGSLFYVLIYFTHNFRIISFRWVCLSPSYNKITTLDLLVHNACTEPSLYIGLFIDMFQLAIDMFLLPVKLVVQQSIRSETPVTRPPTGPVKNGLLTGVVLLLELIWLKTYGLGPGPVVLLGGPVLLLGWSPTGVSLY